VDGRRAPQGLHTEDRLALGLSATHLGYLALCTTGAYAVFSSHLPMLLRAPVAALLAGAGVALAWGRYQQRPLDRWLWLALGFYLRPRSSHAPAGPRLAVVTADEPGAEARERVAATVDGQPQAARREIVAATADDDDPAPETPRILSLPTVAIETRAARADEPAAAPAPVFLGGCQRIAFFSLKGGVGKTTLATETATLLAREGFFRNAPDAEPEPLKVALLDLDMASANVSMKLGISHPTLWDLVMEPDPTADDIRECLVRHRDSGLDVLLGPPRAVPGDEGRAMAVRRIAEVLGHLDEQGYHFVFIDMSSEVNPLTTYLLEAAHHVHLVFTPTASAVQDTYRGVEAVRRLGHRRKLRFVLNQARDGFDTDEMMADLGGLTAARVKHDEAFVEAENDHRPACLSTHTPAHRDILQLAAAIYPGLGEAGGGRRSVWQRLRARIG
jgi:MinD-like ATPase involved in chromosome partitioning or flagellar assembly